MPQHTPGPWKAVDLDTHPYVVAEQGRGWANPIICDLYEDVTPEDSITIGAWLKAFPDAKCNAVLIAEAPAMLEALRDAGAIEPCSQEYRDWMAKIRAIIARIDGVSPCQTG